MSPLRTALPLALVAVLLVGCGGADDVDPSAPTTTGDPGPALEGTLTVFAAASLTEVVDELAEQMQEENPGLTVRASYAGSSDLAAQLQEGAPADVLATADERTMQAVVDAGLTAGEPEVFATNVLTLVTPPDDPAGVASLADAARDDVAVVVCAPQVPCGAATERVEEAAGVTLSPVSEEGSVTDVLGKVTSGEADAGLVYVTDARRAGDAVRVVDVPEAAAAVNRYPVAALADAASPEAAAAFVDLLAGPDGQELLADAGFGPPDGP